MHDEFLGSLPSSSDCDADRRRPGTYVLHQTSRTSTRGQCATSANG